MNPIRLGIIGCGEVTQINHLPSLNYLGDLYEVAALSDLSQEVMSVLGRQHGVAPESQFRDYRGLLERTDLEAVLIATPDAYHAPITLAALAAGKHVLVEKPMCLNLREADQIIEAQQTAGKVVQVGYMRRYAGAFVEACARLGQGGAIRLARVHDVIGLNSQFVQPTSQVLRGSDLSEAERAQTTQLYLAGLREVLGEAPPELYRSYGLMLGLSSHDLSAMRELLGMPQRVLYASQRSGGYWINAAFDYGDFVCHFETGITQLARFDAHLEVFSDLQTLRVSYQSPYIRHLPTTLSVVGPTSQGGTVEQQTHPQWEDNFTAEWRAFYTHIRQHLTPKTDPRDARQDLELFKAVLTALRSQERPVAVAAD